MRPRGCSRLPAWLALLLYGTSTVSGDSKVGPGECTWSGSTTYAGETLTFGRVAVGIDTFGSCRAKCDDNYGVRLVGYEFTTEHCKCFLASGSYDTSPDGATSVNHPGGCYATRPSVWCSSIDRRISLDARGRANVATHADVATNMKPVAHKQIAAAASTAAACICAAFESQWIWGESTHAQVPSHWAGSSTNGVGFDYATNSCTAFGAPQAIGFGLVPAIARHTDHHAAYSNAGDGTSTLWAATIHHEQQHAPTCGEQAVELTTYFDQMYRSLPSETGAALERPDPTTNRIRMSVEQGNGPLSIVRLDLQKSMCHHVHGWAELDPKRAGSEGKGVMLGVVSGRVANFVAVEGYGVRHAVSLPLIQGEEIAFTVDRRSSSSGSTPDVVSLYLTLCCDTAQPLGQATCPSLGYSHATGLVAWNRNIEMMPPGIDSSFSTPHTFVATQANIETDVRECCRICDTHISTSPPVPPGLPPPPPPPPPLPPPEWGLCVDDCARIDDGTGELVDYTNNGVCDVPTHCAEGHDCTDCGQQGTRRRPATAIMHPSSALRSTPATNSYATIVNCGASTELDATRNCAKAFDGCHAAYMTNMNSELQATWRIVSDTRPEQGWCVPYDKTTGEDLPFTSPAQVMGVGGAMKASLDGCEQACHTPCNAVTWHRVTRQCTFYTTTHAWANAVLPANSDWACGGRTEFAWKRTETACSHGQLQARGMFDDAGVAWAANEATPNIVLGFESPSTVNGMRYANRWHGAASAVREFRVTLYGAQDVVLGGQTFFHHCYTSDGYVTHPDEPWRGCVDTKPYWDVLQSPGGAYAVPALGDRGTSIDYAVAGAAPCSTTGSATCTYSRCREICDGSSTVCYAFLWRLQPGDIYKCHFYAADFDLSSASVIQSGSTQAYGFRRGPKGNDFDKHIFRFEHAYAFVASARIDILQTWGAGTHAGAREVEFGYYTVGEKLDDGLAGPPPPAPLGKCSASAVNLLDASHLSTATSIMEPRAECSSPSGFGNIGQDKPYRVEFDIAVTDTQLRQMNGNWSTIFSMGPNKYLDAVMLGLTMDNRLFHRWTGEADNIPLNPSGPTPVGGLQCYHPITAGTHRLVFQFDGHVRSIMLNGVVEAADGPLVATAARRKRATLFSSVDVMCKMSYTYVGSISQLRVYDGVPCVGTGLMPGTQSPPAAPPPPPPLAGDDSLTAYWKFDGDDPLADMIHGHRLVRLGGECEASDERAHWTHVRDRHHVDALPLIRGVLLNTGTHSLVDCKQGCDDTLSCQAIVHNANDNSCEMYDGTYDLRSSRGTSSGPRFYTRDCSEYTPGWARLGGHGTQLVLDGESQYMHMAFPDTYSHNDRVGMTVDNENGFTVCAIAATVNAYPACDENDDYGKCFPVLVSNGMYPGGDASASQAGRRGWSLGMNRRMCRCGGAKQHLAAWGPHHTSVQLGGFQTAASEEQALSEYDDPTKTSFDGVFTGRRSNSFPMENGVLGDVDDLTWGAIDACQRDRSIDWERDGMFCSPLPQP
jgi:hypothetical protein